jgi:hypothetical protein
MFVLLILHALQFLLILYYVLPCITSYLVPNLWFHQATLIDPRRGAMVDASCIISTLFCVGTLCIISQELKSSFGMDVQGPLPAEVFSLLPVFS